MLVARDKAIDRKKGDEEMPAGKSYQNKRVASVASKKNSATQTGKGKVSVPKGSMGMAAKSAGYSKKAKSGGKYE